MTALIFIGIVAAGAAVGRGAHLIVESVTRNKEMKAAVKENNKNSKKIEEDNEETE